MSVPIGTFLDYGFREGRSYELDQTTGLLKATNTTAVIGNDILGNATLEPTTPQPRTISGVSKDGISQVVNLPPVEGMTLKLSVEGVSDILSALFGGTKVTTLGDASETGIETNQKGAEPLVAFLARKRLVGISSNNDGLTYHMHYLFPKVTVIESIAAMNAEKAPTAYDITPRRVGHNILGVPFTRATNGYNRAQGNRYISENPLMLVAWKADGTATEFTFNTDYPAISLAKSAFAIDGALVTPSAVIPAKVTMSAAPTSGKIIIGLYEYLEVL